MKPKYPFLVIHKKVHYKINAVDFRDAVDRVAKLLMAGNDEDLLTNYDDGKATLRLNSWRQDRTVTVIDPAKLPTFNFKIPVNV